MYNVHIVPYNVFFKVSFFFTSQVLMIVIYFPFCVMSYVHLFIGANRFELNVNLFEFLVSVSGIAICVCFVRLFILCTSSTIFIIK